MCTVTWLRDGSGYELFFNRDELRARKEAQPPRRRKGRGDGGAVRFLAPVDGDFGGTWIAVNERGLAIGLLNGFRRGDLEAGRSFRSRGLLVTDLAVASGVQELRRLLGGVELDAHRSFRLLAMAPDAPALVAEWDGRTLEVDEDAEHRRPLISSSFEETEVGAARRAEYARVVGEAPDAERLAAFHRSHENGPSAFSVCMHREDAATRGFTRVTVAPDAVSLRYRPGNPCQSAEETEVSLPREPAP